MNRKSVPLTWLVILSSFVLYACIGLIPLEEEIPVTGGFGPRTSPQEQQAKTFEALWGHFEDNYIYFETTAVDWQALHDQYLERIHTGLTAEEFTALIREMESELPAGSLVYEPRSERIERETADLASFEGIGAFIGYAAEPAPHIILLDVIAGSPAEQAGLKAHDSIFAIDGDPILREEGINAVNRIRGPAGSAVTLTVQSPGDSQRAVEVERGKVTRTGELTAEMIPETNYGYLLFPFIGYDTLATEVIQELQGLTTNRTLEGLVLDLRIANATTSWPLADLYTMFYSGALGEFYNRDNKQLIEVKGQDVFNSQKVPLVILVGQNTSGWPEILAGGLQMHKRAVVIGEITPGAIESRSVFYLPDGSQAIIETASFILPNGTEIGDTGIIPDISMEAGWDEIRPGQDPVLERAIEYLEGQK